MLYRSEGKMWMMGCGDAAGGLSTADTSARKLRPLVPRPTSTQIPSSSSTTTTTSSPSCPPTNFRSIHGHDHFFSLRNHFSVGAEHGKRELAGTTQQVSSRWNPTPEQLRTLEELYRRGTRTPTADQIQHITAQLRRFGKIEGKNVFYWFQNHKARERQKRRRRIEAEERDGDHLSVASDHKKDHSPGPQAADHEMITTKNSNNPCTSTTADHQESSCLCSRTTIPESRKSSEWQVLHHLPPSPPPSLLATTITTAAAVDLDGEQGAVGTQTLELFPLHNDLSHQDGSDAAPLPNATGFGAFQFYQFLPLKN